jgi:type II secretory pathway pseudopilin PulG
MFTSFAKQEKSEYTYRQLLRRDKRGPCGFSMMETTVAISLVSILLVSSLQTLAFTTQHSNRDLENLRALGFAEQLLAEIVPLNYLDPIEPTTALGREPTETSTTNRSAWDDVDDYNGIKESTLRYRDGTTIPNATGWLRGATVTSLVPSTLATTTDLTSPLRRITITLERSGGRSYTFQYLVSRDGFRTPQSLATTTQPAFKSHWQIGNRNYYWGIPLRNMPLPYIEPISSPPPPPSKS